MKKRKYLKSNSENNHLLDEKSLVEQFSELKKVYKASNKTIEKIEEIFLQGDYRYTNVWENIVLSGFIDNSAIKIEKIEEKIPINPNKEEINEIKGPQKIFKFYAKHIVQKKGYEIKEYEPSISGGKGDILAVNQDKEIIIECCSCRISKVIDYLSRQKTILWVILRHITNDEITIFQFSRGKNWKNFLKNHQSYTMDQIDQEYTKISKFF